MTFLRYPPTLSQLLEYEEYFDYFCKNPLIHHEQNPYPPWLLLAQTNENKWYQKLYTSYIEAVNRTNTLLDSSSYRDICIVSRRQFFKRPKALRGFKVDFPWCIRCRRPTIFFKGSNPPGLRDFPLTRPDQKRCFFCGIRETFK